MSTDPNKNGTLVLRSSNVQNGEISLLDNVYVRSEVAYSQNVDEGDIIVVVRNGSRSLIGKHATIKNKMINTVIGAFMTGVKSSQPDFINALFDSNNFTNQVNRNLGATINQITIGAFKEMNFYFPQEEEKVQIGEFFQNLDQSIALHEKKLAQTQNFKKAMLEKMFPKQGILCPEIRLKGFSGDWEERQLKDISFKVLEKNSEHLYSETFTNSAQFGVISQRDFFDKDISNTNNIGGYYVVKDNDFIYNPRISNFAPVGPVKRNKLGRTGVVSPLYFVFRTHDVDHQFLETYFETSVWHKFMFLNGDTGARSDRLAIKDTIFMEMPIYCPSFEEQQKVGQFFKQLDETIKLQQQQLQTVKNLKQALLEKMFV
ncbi:restriction endonuclease subunit S [Acinetobacter lwoffii]|uniref:Type I restriction modification DNA specificity domain-containing protein n=2 Tax=Acinetobacter lwoffii TaxID=28090 RepID=A0ABN0PXT1_ACILW|nr:MULTISPECIES: restriction endonuclease subunit S [Acinetobacter]ENU15992.1 hypothetical protein F995_01458 [Acinetobacter sp. CIP A162]ESJ95353.1 hypothetical protein P800_00157 [Acinetobacter lwoffii NCTC 5866 = CIP 64.10 = NIPH 512]QXB41071.1 restriction endonuclease subunit S [Acinetobacter lwoffii]SUU32627.1 type I restriction-modification system specificity determinant for hsdM and hsdR (HsdS) [Acinetobacter lwoffii]VFQ37095.1 type I restriction-modification system specificity determin